jgi:hypothetical protein
MVDVGNKSALLLKKNRVLSTLLDCGHTQDMPVQTAEVAATAEETPSVPVPTAAVETAAAAAADESGDEEFEVAFVVASRWDNDKVQFRLRWAGYSSDDDTWEYEYDSDGERRICAPVIRAFRGDNNRTEALKGLALATTPGQCVARV